MLFDIIVDGWVVTREHDSADDGPEMWRMRCSQIQRARSYAGAMKGQITHASATGGNR